MLQLDSKIPALRKEGCYFFCLAYCAGVHDLDLIERVYREANTKGFCKNAWVESPDDVLYLFGADLQKFWASNPSDAIDGDQIIAEYDFGTYSHFVVVDKSSNVVYDPMGKDSYDEAIKSCRLIRRQV